MITPFNFLKVNVFDNIAVFYGRNGFFGWYLVQGLPISCGFSCVFAAVRLFSSERLSKLEKGLLMTLIFNWFILEIGSEHKEFRFIMSALPLLTLFGAKPAARIFQNEWLKKIYVGLNLIIGIYLSMVHQRGPGDLARYLRVELCFNEGDSIRFYGPCHVMPGEYSRFCLKGHHLGWSNASARVLHILFQNFFNFNVHLRSRKAAKTNPSKRMWISFTKTQKTLSTKIYHKNHSIISPFLTSMNQSFDVLFKSFDTFT